jgi:hypothetical protein
MPRPLTRLAELAEGQWGLVTTRQAQAAGVGWSTLVSLHEQGRLERVAHGVYRVRPAAEPDHLDLRAAWLQLDPARPAWERLGDEDVATVSHASAASLFAAGDLRADTHEFTLPARRQTSRPDVRLHRGHVPTGHRIILGGLPVTDAAWMIRDLLAAHIEPAHVGQIAAEVMDRSIAYPSTIAEVIAPYASRLGLPRDDGAGLLDQLLSIAGHPTTTPRVRPVDAPA